MVQLHNSIREQARPDDNLSRSTNLNSHKSI